MKRKAWKEHVHNFTVFTTNSIANFELVTSVSSVIGTPSSFWEVGHFPHAGFCLAGACLLEPPWRCAFKSWSLSCSYFEMSVTPAACPLSAGVYCPRGGVTGCIWEFLSCHSPVHGSIFFPTGKLWREPWLGSWCGCWLCLLAGHRLPAELWDGKGEMLSMKHTGATRASDLRSLCKLGCYCVVPEQTYT